MLKDLTNEDKQYIAYALGAVILALVIIFFYKKKNGTKQYEELMEIIEKKGDGRDIVDTNTFERDTNFNPDRYVSAIYEANGVVWDDDQVIYDTFCNNLTQGQIKAVADSFKAKYGQELFTWLKEEFFGNSFVDNGKYNKVMNCIASATK